MADVTLTYKGNTILELNDSATKSIKTAGKYLEDDIGLDYVKSGDSGSSNILEGTIEPSNSVGSNGSIYLKYTDVSVLPNNYTPIDYIKFNGNQYFNTGISSNTSNLRIVTNILITDTRTQGLWGSTWNPNGFLFIIYQSKFRFHSGGKNIDGGVAGTDTWYNIETNKNSLIINGTTYSLDNPSGIDNDANITIGNSTTGSQGSNAYMLIRYIQMYSGNTLVANYIPCLDSNNVPCFYDSIRNQTTYSSSSTAFLGGSQISSGIITNAKLKKSNSWQDLIGSSIEDINIGSEYPPLPSEYQELEYLRTTAESGYARINTVGYGVQAGDHIRLSFRGYGVICGQRNSGWNFNVDTVNNFNAILYNCYKVFYSWEVLEQELGDWCTCELGFNNTYSTDMTYGGWGSSTSSMNYNFFGDLGILLVFRPVVIGNDPKELNYSFECVRALIPCYRKSDGVNGFYDTVADVFHIAFMGTFTRGPEKQ